MSTELDFAPAAGGGTPMDDPTGRWAGGRIAPGVSLRDCRPAQRRLWRNRRNTVLIVLAVGLIAGIAHLYLPLLVDRVLQTGVFAAVLVLLLWIAQWAFKRLPQLRLNAA